MMAPPALSLAPWSGALGAAPRGVPIARLRPPRARLGPRRATFATSAAPSTRGSQRRWETPAPVAALASLTGLQGPRVGNSRESSQTLVQKTLSRVREGDLLSLTVTPGDGAGHLASGEDELRRVYLAVKKISTSTGGKRQLEGECTGLRVQLIEAGAGLQGARLGVVGLALEPGAKWIKPLTGWRAHLARQPELEAHVLASVVGAEIVSSLDALRRAVKERPMAWQVGGESPDRRGIITDPVEAATQTAGELMALLNGDRDVAMAQLWAGWTDAPSQPCELPWALDMIRACVEDEHIGVEMSESDDVEANPGLTAVFYRKTPKQGSKGVPPEESSDESASFTPGRRNASSSRRFAVTSRTNRVPDPAKAAALVAKLGAQAECPAVTPYERVLVGVALGYDDRDIAYHLKQINSPFSAAFFDRAREALGFDAPPPRKAAVADAGGRGSTLGTPEEIGQRWKKMGDDKDKGGKKKNKPAPFTGVDIAPPNAKKREARGDEETRDE